MRSLEAGADHSLSVMGEAMDPSASPTLLASPLALVDAEAEFKLKEEELALIWASFVFSFSSKSMKIRDRACWYAASRSARVMPFLLLLPVALLRPPRLPASEGSTSDRSASSPATEPAWEWGFRRSFDRRMILKAGCDEDSGGTSSQIRISGIRLSGLARTAMPLVIGSLSGASL